MRSTEPVIKEIEDEIDEIYLKVIIESSMDGITVVDEHGKFEFANDSGSHISKWLTPESLKSGTRIKRI